MTWRWTWALGPRGCVIVDLPGVYQIDEAGERVVWIGGTGEQVERICAFDLNVLGIQIWQGSLQVVR